jgi:hypothetical protein
MCAGLTQGRTAVRALEHFRPVELCKHVQSEPARGLVISVTMLNVFSAGQALIRWEVTAVSAEGPYRLGVYHSGGAIVEYFPSVSAALQRERELEVLFTGVRSTYDPLSMAVGQ